MKKFNYKLNDGWTSEIFASGIEEAKYLAIKTARFFQARLVWVELAND